MVRKSQLKATIFSLIIGIFFLILAIFVYLWINSQDRLEKYVPVDAYFYAHLNFDPFTLQGRRLKKASQKNAHLNDFLKVLGENVDNSFKIFNVNFRKDFKPLLSGQVSLALLENENKIIEPLLILEVKDANKMKNILEKLKTVLPSSSYLKMMGLPAQIDYEFLNSRVVVIGGLESLNKVKSVTKNKNFSFASSLKTGWSKGNLIYVYVNLERVSKNFQNLTFKNQLSGLLEKIESLEGKEIYFAFSFQNNKDLIAELKTPTTKISEENFLFNHLEINRVFKALPQNYSLVVWEKNLSLALENTLRLLETDNQLFGEFAKIYEVTKKKPYPNLENTPVAISILNQNSSFLMIFEALNSEGQDELEEVTKNILAYQFPLPKEKNLPDNTTVTELIPDPGLFKARTIYLDSQEKKLVFEKDKVKYYLEISPRQVTLGNHFFENNFPVTKKETLCFKGFASQFISFSPLFFYENEEVLSNLFLNLFDKINISFHSQGNTSLLKGCSQLQQDVDKSHK